MGSTKYLVIHLTPQGMAVGTEGASSRSLKVIDSINEAKSLTVRASPYLNVRTTKLLEFTKWVHNQSVMGQPKLVGWG